MEQYPLPIATAYLEELKSAEDKEEKPTSVPNGNAVVVAEPEQDLDAAMSAPEAQNPVLSTVDELIQKRTGDFNQPADVADTPVRFREKKRLHWTGKTCTRRVL